MPRVQDAVSATDCTDQGTRHPRVRLFGHAVVVGLVLLLAGLWTSLAKAAEPYLLGPSDKIQVRVVEWRPGRGDYLEWIPLNGEYTVGPSGLVLLPLVGEVRAQGLTPAALANAIASGLQARIGMLNPPNASVEIVQYRPIYVIGEVERPGEYPFRPGLDVLQAISLAGGLYRLSEAGLLRLERDRISVIGTWETTRLERRRLLARQARLEAELADGAIALPEELSRDGQANQLLASEAAILQVRREALRSRLAALNDLKNLLTREIASLNQKIETQMRQVAIARRELRDVTSLRDRGLSVTARETGLERVVAELESRLIDYETAILRAQQEVARADRDALDHRTEHHSRVVTELNQTRADLDQNAAKLATAQGLVDEATVTAPRLALDQSSKRVQQPLLSILRREGEQTTEQVVGETMQLRPGDSVRVGRIAVELGMPDSSGGRPVGLTPERRTPSEVSRRALPANATSGQH